MKQQISNEKYQRSVKKKSKLRDWGESLLWALALAFVVRSFFIQAFKIPSGSMEDTLLIGDFLLVDKFTYGMKLPYIDKQILPALRKPKRGDIIVFRAPHDKKDFIKRCIAVPGDTVEIRKKKVYINHELQFEPYRVFKDPNVFDLDSIGLMHLSLLGYDRLWRERKFLSIPGEMPWIRDNFGPIVIPENTLFMMGDNRDNSSDSRFWGPMPVENIKGKALVIYWSWDSPGFDPAYFFWKKIRWGRLFTLIR